MYGIEFLPCIYSYGHLTWEWKNGLRGYTYPAMFAALFKILGILHLDTRILLVRE